jgi:hypothetical protein
MFRTLALATLIALTPIAAHAADRDTVAEQIAEKCRTDYQAYSYTIQLGCRKMEMEAFDKLQQEDKERAARKAGK